ncbi:MAG: M48 family metalloprotease, partial [Verrucomicrobiae bacterium]|nr:M48 family metalloprotease [Verrucomicrobiae bacterium]
MMEPILDSLISAGSWTLRNTLEASVFIGFLLLLSFAFGNRLSPVLRAMLWAVAGLRLILPFAPPSALSVFNLSPAITQPSVADQVPDRVVEFSAMTKAEVVAVPELTSGFTMTLPSWGLVLSLIWLLGAVTLISRAVVRQVRAARVIRGLPVIHEPELNRLLKECARQVGVRLKLSFVAGPPGTGVAIFGFLRETHLIVPADLPTRYSAAEIRGILLHELAHVRRHDLLSNWIALIIQSLHWFNPLVWLAGRRFLADREVLCDRVALRGVPSPARREYGAALIKALELSRAPKPCPALVPFISRKSELQHRLKMIAKPHSPNLTIQLVAAGLAAAVCVTTFTSATADERSETSRNSSEAGREGARDGDKPREGARDGDRPREGAR